MLHGNDVRVRATDDELISLGLGLAEGHMTTDEVIAWIESHTNAA